MKTIKRLVIGDIHGHWDNFIKIYNYENPDEVIMLGDYFDNFHGSDKSIIDCFDNLLTLQEAHNKYKSGSFIMLIGNHDYHYLYNFERYSGYRSSYATVAHIKLNDCLDKKLIRYIYADNVNRVIYSHAGVTNKWMSKWKVSDVKDLNMINDLNPLAFSFDNLCKDGYGGSLTSSPIWIRPESLVFDNYEDTTGYAWTQIVGHTNSSTFTVIKQDGKFCYTLNDVETYKGSYHPNNSEWNMIYIMDCMPNYYIVETIDFETEKIIKRQIINNIYVEVR